MQAITGLPKFLRFFPFLQFKKEPNTISIAIFLGVIDISIDELLQIDR